MFVFPREYDTRHSFFSERQGLVGRRVGNLNAPPPPLFRVFPTLLCMVGAREELRWSVLIFVLFVFVWSRVFFFFFRCVFVC